MELFELKLRISPSDSQFRELIGHEAYNKLHSETLKKSKFTCNGCGNRPLDDSKISSFLKLHVIEVNEKSPEESSCCIFCIACHSTQHIDIAIEKEWVELVNSTFSQSQLIVMCRTNGVLSSLTKENTRHLKIKPLDFLTSIKDGTLSENTKAKVLFTNKFEWGDL